MLVTGGWGWGGILLSTELLLDSALAWASTGELPSPRYLLRGANIDKKILMTG